MMQFCDAQLGPEFYCNQFPSGQRTWKKSIPKWFGSKVLRNLSSPAVQWESQHWRGNSFYYTTHSSCFIDHSEFKFLQAPDSLDDLQRGSKEQHL